jgi:hypothetical protein
MVPLQTIQGLSTDQLRHLIDQRDVYIWGSGVLGRSVLRSLKKSGITTKGFLDGRLSERNSVVCDLPVFYAEQVAKDPSSFIIIATINARKQAIDLCRLHGREQSKSYLTHYQIARPVAAINVSGQCTLSCPSCPLGNMKHLGQGGIMSYSTYVKILDKVQQDVPNLVGVELQTWGEPFQNPDLPDIIRYTEPSAACTLATNLQNTAMIAPVLRAQPSYLNITVNGYNESYETNMRGASWSLFTHNLQELVRVRRSQHSMTVIRLIAYAYENKPDEAKALRALADEAGIPVCFGHSYVNPYEHYLEYANGARLPEGIDRQIKDQGWDMDAMLAVARTDADNPCLCQRIFPIINWDSSVSLCHTYMGPVIATDYLKVSWSDLLALRHGSAQCIRCQEKGLHRLDLDVLQRKYEPSNKEQRV